MAVPISPATWASQWRLATPDGRIPASSSARAAPRDQCALPRWRLRPLSSPTPRRASRSATSGQLSLHPDFGTIIFTSGFRPDYASWVRFPKAFDSEGFPIQKDGSSTVVPGLHFMGVHFQRKRKSATFLGVGEDAIVLAENISAG